MGIDRRNFLDLGVRAAIAGVLCPLATAAAAAEREPIAKLDIWGPPAGPSITILHAIATGRLRKAARRARLRPWRNPDEMRAGLTSGAMQIGVMPVASAANLFNRGMPLRLVNVMTNGLLYIISEDRTLNTLEALKGRKLAALYPNETPSILLNRLLRSRDIDAKRDLTITPTATPLEAIQLLLIGRVDAALVPEPAASAAIVRGGLAGRDIARVIDIQAQWGKLSGFNAVPQAGLAVTKKFLTTNAGIIEAVQEGLAEAVAEVVAEPARAANSSAGELKMPWPVIEKSIKTSNLVAIPARQARASIEAMLETAAEGNPGIIGGKLPADDFYL